MSACCNGLSCERPCEHGIHLDQQQCFLCDLQRQIDEINNGLIKRIGILGEALHTLSEENNKLSKKPYKCPLCDGLGENRLDRNGMLLSFPPKWPNCKVCKGEGIVWG